MRRVMAFAWLAIVLMLGRGCHADDGMPFTLPASWWVNGGGISHHSEPVANSNNRGVGLEARWSDTWSVIGGTMRNSQDRRSRYLAAEYTPVALPEPVVGPVHAGVVVGLIDGYDLNNGRPVPLVAGVLERRWQRLAVGLVWSPKVPGVSKGAVMLMLKVRVTS